MFVLQIRGGLLTACILTCVCHPRPTCVCHPRPFRLPARPLRACLPETSARAPAAGVSARDSVCPRARCGRVCQRKYLPSARCERVCSRQRLPTRPLPACVRVAARCGHGIAAARILEHRISTSFIKSYSSSDSISVIGNRKFQEKPMKIWRSQECIYHSKIPTGTPEPPLPKRLSDR